jgi:hypothetical protein
MNPLGISLRLSGADAKMSTLKIIILKETRSPLGKSPQSADLCI